MVLAAIVTIVALPAVWLADRDRAGTSAAPGVAAVGLADQQVTAETEPVELVGDDPMGSVAPLLPDSPVTVAPRHVQYQSPVADRAVLLAEATFRRSVSAPNICMTDLVGPREQITVINLDNGQSIDCYTRAIPPDSPDRLILRTDTFASFADVTDAPIHVEIHVEPDQ